MRTAKSAMHQPFQQLTITQRCMASLSLASLIAAMLLLGGVLVPTAVQAQELPSCESMNGSCIYQNARCDGETKNRFEAFCPLGPGPMGTGSTSPQICCIENQSATQPTPEVPAFTPIEPRLTIPFTSGFQWSRLEVRNADGGLETISMPWIADYIQMVYNVAIGIASVLAATMMMIGGFQYVTALGDAGRASEGKKRIMDALIGLVLALSAYLLLSTVSGSLVNLSSINVQMLQRQIYEPVYGGDSDDPLYENTITNPPPGVFCPKEGQGESVAAIVNSLVGKVTYRFGGKGGAPPYKEVRSDYMKYNNNCPSDNLCLDCSGFVNYVLRCAGLPAPGGGTANIFGGSAEHVTAYDITARTVNGRALNRGDLIGYLAASSKSGVGHVLIYIGDGKVAESHGGDDGRQPGAAVRIVPLSDSLMKTITYIRRAPNTSVFNDPNAL